MTKEERQLLLVDLCARLPYGVICHYNCVTKYDTMVIHKANCINKLEGIIPFFNGQIGYMVGGDKVNALSGDIKPYLRPMSSMTEEEKETYRIIIKSLFENSVTNNIATLYNFLNSKHLDYNGLIPKGLAIEVTEENNPYK